MPLAAALLADSVSSERCAEASKPVIVYCVSRKPNGTIANQNAKPPVLAVVEAGVVEPLGEDVAERLVLVGHQHQDQHDRRGADDVPPDRHVVHDRHQVAAEDVQQGGQEQHHHEDDEHPRQGVVRRVALGERAQRQVDEGGAAVGHTGGHRHQPDQVEPAGEEAGGRAAELGGPPVDAAGGRVRRHQLGHGEADDQDEDARGSARTRRWRSGRRCSSRHRSS